jgi:hypothetical protein
VDGQATLIVGCSRPDADPSETATTALAKRADGSTLPTVTLEKLRPPSRLTETTSSLLPADRLYHASATVESLDATASESACAPCAFSFSGREVVA